MILLYLEELRDGRGLIEAARRVTRGDQPKPILAIKSGRTPQGADAAASHTGSLAGEDAICDAVFREAGIIRVASIEELFNAAILYAYQPLPAGNRLAIVTNAGGPGVMATDAAVRAGLRVPRLAEATMAKLRASLPAAANIKNPVDVIGDARADRYTAALEARAGRPQRRPGAGDPHAAVDDRHRGHRPAASAASTRRPPSRSPARSWARRTWAAGIRMLQEAHIPHYILPEWACEAMACVQKIRQWRGQPMGDAGPVAGRRGGGAGDPRRGPGRLPRRGPGAGGAGGLRAARAAAPALHHGRRRPSPSPSSTATRWRSAWSARRSSTSPRSRAWR